jgi:hypothetical protein
MKKKNRDIGKLESCIIVIDYNPRINDDVEIRCFKDRNEAREHGYTNPKYLDSHSINLGEIIKAIKKGETYIASY